MMNGIIEENPIFVLLLGMCPTLGTTSSAINGMGMGLATMFVLICSNVVISSIKNLIPDMVRIPSFIVVIASFVTLLQMIMQAYVPDLYATLGLFIPLIVVNCIVLGRAEAFAAKNNPLASMFDGIGMGFGFTIALTLLGAAGSISILSVFRLCLSFSLCRSAVSAAVIFCFTVIAFPGSGLSLITCGRSGISCCIAGILFRSLISVFYRCVIIFIVLCDTASGAASTAAA